MEFKLKNGLRFLTDGDKVKVTVMYRGREMVHRELGRKQLDRVVELLGPIASVENPPRMEGRLLSMILVPNREAIEAARKVEAEKSRESIEAEKPEESVDTETPLEASVDAETPVDVEKPPEESVAVGDELTGE